MIAPHASNRTRLLRLDLEDALLPLRARPRLLGGEEAGAHVRARGAQRQDRGQAAAVGHAARGEDRDRRDGVHDLGYERHGADAPRHPLAARLAALGDDDVDAALRHLARLGDGVDLVDGPRPRLAHPLHQGAGIAQCE
jgi:hypothetical protein